MTNLKLGNVLRKGGLFLVDGSVKNYSSEEGLLEICKNASSFRGMNKDSIDREVFYNEKFFQILSCDKSFITREVLDELTRYQSILMDAKRRIVRKSSRGSAKGAEKSSEKASFLKACEKTNNFMDWAHDSVISIRDPRHDILVDMLKDVSSHYKLKDKVLNSGEVIPGNYAVDTDERVVATALYLSTFGGPEESDISLFFGDRDFMNLSYTGARAIGASQFSPHNDEFRIAMKNRFPKLYFFNKGKITDMPPLRNFYIDISAKDRLPLENEGLKDGLFNYWARISKLNKEMNK